MVLFTLRNRIEAVEQIQPDRYIGFRRKILRTIGTAKEIADHPCRSVSVGSRWHQHIGHGRGAGSAMSHPPRNPLFERTICHNWFLRALNDPAQASR